MNARDLIELLLRWGHVFAAMMWIGATWYFTWLDKRFHDPVENPNGQVWMVHSGGFYVVEKRLAPELAQRKLHWFKWEAALTWLTGLFLFGVLYHGRGLLVSADSPLSRGAASGLSFALLAVAWLVYDLLWKTPLGKRDAAGAVVGYLLMVAAAWALPHWFAPRAAWLQLGAMLGTIMAANVWMRILPAQRRMIKAKMEGREPDQRDGERAKTRSKHNTFIVLPVIALMISNHYPTLTYGATNAWLSFAVIVLVGWAVAAVVRSH